MCITNVHTNSEFAAANELALPGCAGASQCNASG